MYLGEVMTAEEVAAYRDEILTAQGLINDGTGNYYDASYYAAQPAAQAAHDANVAATAASGVFAGVQGNMTDAPAATVSTTTPGATMTYTNPNPNIKPITDAAQLATIKATYLAMVPGNIPGFVNLMIQYGVSIYDVANATQRDPAFIAAQLNQPNGFGGYYKPGTSGSSTTTTAATNATATAAASSNTPLLLAAAAAGAYFLLT